MTDDRDLVITTPLELEIRRLLAEHREGARLEAEEGTRRAKRSARRWFVCACVLAVLLCGTIAAGGYFGHQRIIAIEGSTSELAANQLDLGRIVDLHERRLGANRGPL